MINAKEANKITKDTKNYSKTVDDLTDLIDKEIRRLASEGCYEATISYYEANMTEAAFHNYRPALIQTLKNHGYLASEYRDQIRICWQFYKL